MLNKIPDDYGLTHDALTKKEVFKINERITKLNWKMDNVGILAGKSILGQNREHILVVQESIDDLIHRILDYDIEFDKCWNHLNKIEEYFKLTCNL